MSSVLAGATHEVGGRLIGLALATMTSVLAWFGLTGDGGETRVKPVPASTPPFQAVVEEVRIGPRVLDVPPGRVEEPDLPGYADWRERYAGAPDAVTTELLVTLQGAGRRKVVIRGIELVVDRQVPPRTGAVFKPADVGGMLAKRTVAVDLDTGAVAAGSRWPVPLWVDATEAEVLGVIGEATRCDCRWRLKLHWSNGIDRGVHVIDDHGRPFRTVGAKGRPAYSYDSFAERWVRGWGS